MMFPSTLLVGVSLMVPVVDEAPSLDVEQVCEGIAQRGEVTFRATNKKNCLDSESRIRDQLVKEWSSFPAADKATCTNEATTSGQSTYAELSTCLERARQVRTLRDEVEKPSATVPPK
jgi:hypothetical protein